MVPQQEAPQQEVLLQVALQQEVVMVLLSDFLALALVSVVLVVLPQVARLPQEAPRALRVALRVLPLVVGALWVALALLWVGQ